MDLGDHVVWSARRSHASRKRATVDVLVFVNKISRVLETCKSLYQCRRTMYSTRLTRPTSIAHSRTRAARLAPLRLHRSQGFERNAHFASVVFLCSIFYGPAAYILISFFPWKWPSCLLACLLDLSNHALIEDWRRSLGVSRSSKVKCLPPFSGSRSALEVPSREQHTY